MEAPRSGVPARPRVVIVGGGFGGLTAALKLKNAPVDITLIDRRNHHLFQPLLYQVATAALSPAQIAHPLRAVLERQKNARVIMGEVIGVDVARRVIQARDPDGDRSSAGREPATHEISYDYLVLAAGVSHSYFGHEDWAPFAPGLKSIEDALEIRRRFLTAFERAEAFESEEEKRSELTFVVIGGGPTGVEMAGAMQEIALKTMPKEFRTIDTRTARVVLIEAQDRLLPGGFPSPLSIRAKKDLEQMGVEVFLKTLVTSVDTGGVTLKDESGERRLDSRNVIWAAGVRASPIAKSLGVALDKSGRVMVEKDLSITAHPEVFVIGDLAHVIDAKTGQQVPGMSPGAMQMGRFVARTIAREVGGASRARGVFEYTDKGQLATIGRAKAVAFVGGKSFGGLIAWLLWALVHLFYLISFRSKVLVMLEWMWAYVFFDRGARLITGGGRRSAPTSPNA